MKRKKMLDVIGMADDKYIDEAAPCASARTAKRSSRFKLLIMAAALALVITATCMWLFIPYLVKPDTPDIDEEELGEYYGIAKKLNAYFYESGYYTTNFDKIFGGVGKDDATIGNAEIGFDSNTSNRPMTPSPDGAVDGSAVSGSNNSITGSGQTYEETTDNQVAGVIEADIIKRSDKYIYYVDAYTIFVYSIAGEESALVERFDYSNPEEQLCPVGGYLSEDCNTFTIIASQMLTDEKKWYDDKYIHSVFILSLDVSDPENVKLSKKISVSGRYLTSRMVDGELLLLTTFRVYSKTDFSNFFDFIPQIDTGNGKECIPANSIVCPDKISAASYSVICRFSEKELTPTDTMAFLSYVDTTYVSLDSVYVSRRIYHNSTSIEGIEESKTLSEICRVGYKGDSFAYSGVVTVNGYLKDQYSLDEYNGILRVVTTTADSKRQIKTSGNSVSSTNLSNGTNASLYCVDINSMKVLSSVENFAPWGEVVRSVRFDGNAAYVCTSIQRSDPVFFFDLSDINNITYKDTGTIEGFSSSLVNFGEGYLLGIGQGSEGRTLKIEIYKESETGVVSVCQFELPDVEYSTNYKAYFIDREHKMIGLGIIEGFSTGDYSGEYLLLRFNEETQDFDVLLKTPFGLYHDHTRAVYIDGYFYMFCKDTFKVEKIAQ